MNDTYAEWDTIETINAIKDALELFHEVYLIEANEEAYEKFRALKPDIVFNVAEGFNGISREAQIPAMLDMLGIPYTGSDPLTLTTCLDKSRTKEILSYYGIPNAKFMTVESIDDIINFTLSFPVIIKPIAEGSSKGIFNSSLVNNTQELHTRLSELLDTYKQPLLIEEFLPGREFTVAIMGNNDDIEVLPIVEINYSSLPENLLPIYSFEAKWIVDTPENPLNIFNCPAQLDDNLKIQIEKTALSTYKILRCRDWARIDIRLDINDIPNVIEVNPLPGVLPNPEDNSCFPKAARAAGLSYSEMINKVLYHAAKRYNLI
ncbi:D-alanine--D-alanine ligase family protein [Melioribacter sp. OK-6-Me]|uniref:D-alanine--D-alanine ligase family protein n=1 Tax=unclassified Melioribacter TaxID=2627329 RepID=UPI003EDA26FE